MPEQLTYPGVYVREQPSGVRTITGVATSITAFVGSAARGPLNDPQTIESFTDFVRGFGELAAQHRLGYAVQDFFRNGGGQAVIVRVAGANHAPTKFDLGGAPVAAPPADGDGGAAPADDGGAPPADGGGGDDGAPPADGDDAPAAKKLLLEATSPGSWANDLTVSVDYDTRPDADGNPRATDFNLTIASADPLATPESLRNLSTDPADPRYAPRAIAAESRLVRADATIGGAALTRPQAGDYPASTEGSPGDPIKGADILGEEDKATGIYALAKADLFNLLVLPPPTAADPTPLSVYSTALEFCRNHRAVLLIDAALDADDGASTHYLGNDWKAEAPKMLQKLSPGSKKAEYGAVYFPRVRRGVDTTPATGAIAGVIARNDALRGVWKAPAGTEVGLDVDGVSVPLDDRENGVLNPQGINCVRTLPLFGTVVWGARTIAGSDQIGSEYKYLPVRRTALYIEETLYRALKWVVFEPNDEPLWSQIRLNVGAFMQGLFRQGAFQGTTPRDAYFVKCDKETTTQNDINLGIVNVVVGFAPLKPAEFVVITIQQIAGQIQT